MTPLELGYQPEAPTKGKTMTAQKLTPKMVEALFAAADGRNTRNMHGTYKALETRGFVEYVWGRTECWVITPAGVTLASNLRASAA